MSGCADTTACNYDASVTDPDVASCIYQAYYNCDGTCINVRMTTWSAMSLRWPVAHSSACNYDASVTDSNPALFCVQAQLQLRRGMHRGDVTWAGDQDSDVSSASTSKPGQRMSTSRAIRMLIGRTDAERCDVHGVRRLG